jgi:hypothetical protein
MSWSVDPRVRHQPETEAQKFECRRFAGAPTSNQAIEAVRELKFDPGQKPSSNAQCQHHVVRDWRGATVFSGEVFTGRTWLVRFRDHLRCRCWRQAANSFGRG